MFRRTLTLILLCSVAAVEAEPPTLWQQMARQDLEFIHQTLARHHPGPLDEANPEFARWHEHGLRQVMLQLDKVNSYGGYRAIVQQFVAGFRDGHLNANLYLDYLYVGTSGFSVDWRGDGFVVTQSSLDVPVVGDRLLSCDGVDAIELFNSRVLGFAGLGIEADRYRLAGELFRNRVNPLLEEVSQCRFLHQGETRTVELSWNWQLTHEVMSESSVISSGEFARTELADGAVWLSMPTFSPEGEQVETLKAMLESLKTDRDRPYIVIDVRGNGGGSSYWAEPFVRNLYGDNQYESIDLDSDAYAVYRVSDDNLTHFTRMLERISQREGSDTDFYRHFEAVRNGIAEGLENGQTMYDSRSGDDEPVVKNNNVKALFDGRLYLLTDSVCASACLDFSDVILTLPGVVHVGHPTSADTTYMEVRSVRLPSNNGTLGFATKVYRNRTRGQNQAYEPAHRWSGDISDTAALRAWIGARHHSGATP